MTEIMKISDKNALTKSVEMLSKGGVIIYPTETCYGIGADATNDEAVKKVIEMKKRSRKKKVSIAFSDIKMAKRYLVVTKNAEKLAKALMPGPLTLIVESRTNRRTEGASVDSKKKVGFRIPDNNLVRRLIKKLGKPVTATSANISGREEIYKIKDIINTFDGKIDLILDAGNLKKTKPSTVYDVMENKVLRTGPVSEKQIKAALV